ncbi:hypothetical protein CPLU01_01339 [Colletotrichum plurivorum]|uniref:Uncharacterized protein n=1 Tax=Colletotrichum plurivorum TaxID=2175906 RepID=A0A8H6U544_9PEZI|nr:hypothetical protein CPLU01_01339 [Colletotrichum plurivorum]
MATMEMLASGAECDRRRGHSSEPDDNCRCSLDFTSGLNLTQDLLRHISFELDRDHDCVPPGVSNSMLNNRPASVQGHNLLPGKGSAQPFDELHNLQQTVGRVIRAAKHMAMNPFCWAHKQCTFFLHHPRALDLVHNALSSAGIESDTLCIEYFPGRGEMTLKSPESPVNSDLIVRFDRLLRDAVESNNNPLHLVNKRDAVVTVGEEVTIDEHIMAREEAKNNIKVAHGQLQPDEG